MQPLDCKQLVCPNNEQSPSQKRPTMDTHAKMAWFAVICLGLIALAHCVPVEYVYTGEGCECPSKLDYSVNVPKIPKPKKYTPSEYGYKVDVPPPVQAKAKVSYTFDFTVEEPRTPKPEKPAPKWNLYAKVDRVAVNKGDCEDSYGAASAPSTCRCGQCGITKPLYRYVYKKVAPCKCQRPNCKCNQGRSYSYPTMPESSYSAPRTLRSPTYYSPQPLLTLDIADTENEPEETRGNSIRRKRDLQRAFFRPRKFAKERPGRFVKLYHKNLQEGNRPLFALDGFLPTPGPAPQKAKRKAKKAIFTPLRSRLVKRDIKGEYDLLEKEREQMDLTLPEIIQFMPETLQPNFKRGQCYFGCSTQQRNKQPSLPSSTEFNIASKEIIVDDKSNSFIITNNDSNSNNSNSSNNSDNDNNNDSDIIEALQPKRQKKKPRFLKITNTAGKNRFSTSHKKRNAANYNQRASTYSDMPPFYARRSKKKAYYAQSPTHIPTDPLYETTKPPVPPPSTSPPAKSAYSAPLPPAMTSPPRYFYDHLGRKYVEHNGRLSLTVSSTTVPDPMERGTMPLQYAGDLDAPSAEYKALMSDELILGAPPKYPVQHITNQELDRVIAEIIFRHPDFIDATSHYGGALIDPEPWQEEETKEFLKKLIGSRLNLWWGHEDDQVPHYSSAYSNPFDQYTNPPLLSLLPALY